FKVFSYFWKITITSILMRFIITILLFSTMFFLTGCPKKDPDPQKSDDRVPLTGKPVLVVFERDVPAGVECGKTFEIKGIPFLIERKTNDNNRCYYPDEKYSLRIGWGSEVTINLTKYNNINSIRVNVYHTNVYGGHDGSEVILYDLDDKIISQSITKKYDQNNNISFNENLSN